MMGDIENIESMDVDNDENAAQSNASINVEDGVSITRKRKPHSNIRHENKENRMTRLGKTHFHYSDDMIIGNGSTSIVYKGYFQFEHKSAAIKRMSDKYAGIVKDELDIWMKVGDTVCAESVNVVQLFGYRNFQEGDQICHYFAMELAKADLEKVIFKMKNENDSMWKQKTIGYLEDGAKGLSWLHTKRIIHRDVKPKNFLVFDVNGKEVCKICDFGISKKLSEMSTGTDSMGRGTSDWMAPEALRSFTFEERFYSCRSLDIFSFGMTAHFAMSQGLHPFRKSKKYGINKSFNVMEEGIFPDRLEAGGNEADHLFSWAMSKDANLRPKIDQVLLHPFFWSPSKKLEFIVDFAKCMDNRKNPHVMDTWNRIDRNYQKYRKSFNCNFDWKDKIDFEVIECLFGRTEEKTRMQLKQYDGKSLMNMVFLLRDKDMHYTGLDKKLICERFFGEVFEGQYCFSKEKFMNYFLERYADFVIFIFVFLVTDEYSRKYSMLKGIRKNHKLNHFLSDMKNI